MWFYTDCIVQGFECSDHNRLRKYFYAFQLPVVLIPLSALCFPLTSCQLNLIFLNRVRTDLWCTLTVFQPVLSFAELHVLRELGYDWPKQEAFVHTDRHFQRMLCIHRLYMLWIRVSLLNFAANCVHHRHLTTILLYGLSPVRFLSVGEPFLRWVVGSGELISSWYLYSVPGWF